MHTSETDSSDTVCEEENDPPKVNKQEPTTTLPQLWNLRWFHSTAVPLATSLIWEKVLKHMSQLQREYNK